MRKEIAALRAEPVKNSNFLVPPSEHSNSQMFSDVVLKLVREGHQAEVNVHKEWKPPVNAYAKGCQVCLNALYITVVERFVNSTPYVQEVMDAPAVLTPESQNFNGSQV